MDNFITGKINNLFEYEINSTDSDTFAKYIINIEKDIMLYFITNYFNSKFDFINLRRIVNRMRKISFKNDSREVQLKKLKSIVKDFL